MVPFFISAELNKGPDLFFKVFELRASQTHRALLLHVPINLPLVFSLQIMEARGLRTL
jgi:hypothetical protein